MTISQVFEFEGGDIPPCEPFVVNMLLSMKTGQNIQSNGIILYYFLYELTWSIIQHACITVSHYCSMFSEHLHGPLLY